MYKLNCPTTNCSRRGAVVVVFAIVLPVLLLLAAIAINMSQMQLTRTELKIATDAAARGGGRAWSEFQDLTKAKDYAQQAASMNPVGGKPLALSTSEADGEIIFGDSSQKSNRGRFEFKPLSESQVIKEGLATGIQINANHPSPLFFQVGDVSSFTSEASSVASVMDRDIALVIDRSGSMAFFEGRATSSDRGEKHLYDTLTALYEEHREKPEGEDEDETDDDEAEEKYVMTEEDYLFAVAAYQAMPSLAQMPLNSRKYSDDILDLLTGDLKEYAETINSEYQPKTGAPKYSRWYMLEQAKEAFFDVLGQTVQVELVSIASFASSAELNVSLTSDMTECRNSIDAMVPTGATAIGEGMLEAYNGLKTAKNSRGNAIKTLIVFSDGISNTGKSPEEAADDIITDNPSVIIHTVTFGAEADVDSMRAVAQKTTGKHYHANDGAELVDIFRELAASHRTLITE